MIELNDEKTELTIKLNANFKEIIKDLNSFYSLDTEQEIKNMLIKIIEEELNKFLEKEKINAIS